MIEAIEINLTKLLKLDLNINEYLTLLKLYLLNSNQLIPFKSDEVFITHLINKGYLKLNNDIISFTDRGLKIFKQSNPGISEKEFDELFFLYPNKTPGGRMLRAKSKEVMGKITRDYSTLYSKYIKAAKTLDNHMIIVEATKNMIYDYKRRGSLEFLPKLETYVNQCGWEKYVGLSPVEISGENVEKI